MTTRKNVEDRLLNQKESLRLGPCELICAYDQDHTEIEGDVMSWKVACAFADIKGGELKLVSIDDVNVLLVGGESVAYAIPPMCPHMEEPLENGICDGKKLTCLKHLWQWDLDSGDPIGEAKAPLLRYPTKIDQEGLVHVLVEAELIYEWSES